MSKAKKKETDPMLEGFVSTYGGQNKTPYDFLTDELTGKRPDENRAPTGCITTELTNGTSGRTIPPMKIWEQGQWLDAISDEEMKALNIDTYSYVPKVKDEQFAYWVCSGDGTPGNYKWRIFKLPNEIAANQYPAHPSKWPKRLKEYSSVWKTEPKNTAPPLPAGMRFRCQGCGHWFKESDLGDHVKNCCPALGEQEWAIQCFCCDSLDLTVKVKDGFPRKPKVQEPVEVTVPIEVTA